MKVSLITWSVFCVHSDRRDGLLKIICGCVVLLLFLVEMVDYFSEWFEQRTDMSFITFWNMFNKTDITLLLLIWLDLLYSHLITMHTQFLLISSFSGNIIITIKSFILIEKKGFSSAYKCMYTSNKHTLYLQWNFFCNKIHFQGNSLCV